MWGNCYEIGKSQPIATNIDAVEPRANKVLFDDGRITRHFNNGAIFSFLPSMVEAIAAITNRNISHRRNQEPMVRKLVDQRKLTQGRSLKKSNEV